MNIPQTLKGIALRRDKSHETKELAKAMCKCQLEFPDVILKEDKGYDEHGEYFYCGLPSLQKAYKKILAKNGVWLTTTCEPNKETGQKEITVTLTHAASDQFVSSTFDIRKYESLRAEKSACTQSRRAIIEMLLDLSAEDTDAQEVLPEERQRQSDVRAIAEHEIIAADDIKRVDHLVKLAGERRDQGKMTDEDVKELEELAKDPKQDLQAAGA